MIKYNEIMENATVNPEMKSRIMSAVSAAIKEQSNNSVVEADFDDESTPFVSAIPHTDKRESNEVIFDGDGETSVKRKKAKKSPIIWISSIAAVVVIAGGVIFVMTRLNNSKAESAYNLGGQAAESIDSIPDVNFEEDRENPLTQRDGVSYGDKTLSAESVNGTDVTISVPRDTTGPVTAGVEGEMDVGNEGVGDARLDRIKKALPFDLKGSGTGKCYDVFEEEVFFGVNGERVLLLSGDINKLISYYLKDNNSVGTDVTTSGGTVLRLYRVVFGNVGELAKNEASADVNAALFKKDGKAYLIVFSDPQSTETISNVVDAL